MLRVGLVAPCIGVGGGDALMLGLVHYAQNLQFTGVAVGNPIYQEHYEWSRKAVGDVLPIHSVAPDEDTKINGVNYHKSHSAAIMAAIDGCDIVLTWCIHSLDRHVPNLIDVPFVDYIQNSDEYARKVVQSNIDIMDFHAACSRTAAKVMPKDKKCTVIYNGIDPGRVVPRIGRERQRQVWGLADRKIALFMGRFVEEKHPELLLAALSHLPDEWVVVYVGKGYLDLNIYKQAQLHHPDRVFWVDPQYHVGDILSAADVFVLPSDFEGHSLALSEAGLAGVPAVYTDFETMDELESMFGPLGVRVKRVCSGQELAEGILQADKKPNPHVHTAQNVVWNNFTLPTIAWQWEEYLHDCVQVWRKRKRLCTASVTLPRKPVNEAH